VDTEAAGQLGHRDALPGEPRAATLVRLAERADQMFAAQEDFLVFHPNRGPIDTAEVNDILDGEDSERASDLAHA
jgi:hypothetical protein